MTSSQSDTLFVQAPAKINLTLAVRGRRPDGFHELESWVVCVDLFDDLALRPSSSFQLEIQNDDTIPTDERNLIHQAAHAMASRAGIAPNVGIQLRKRIPAGAGLGGGSSDAAACLIGLNNLWDLNWGIEELAAIGAGIGSDVPLFIHGGQLVMRGRGEQIERLDREIAGWAVLVSPSIHLSTADVYAAYAHAKQDRVAARPWEANNLDCDGVMGDLFNDLELPAFVVEPALHRLHQQLDGLDDRRVRLTGSGSALFAIFSHATDAIAWAARVEALATGADVFVHRILPNTKARQI